MKDLGSHRLKGLNRDTQLLQLMPRELEERVFPEIGKAKESEEKNKSLQRQLEELNEKNSKLVGQLEAIGLQFSVYVQAYNLNPFFQKGTLLHMRRRELSI